MLCFVAESSSQFSFTLFGSTYVFFKYTIDKKRRRESIDCCYLYKTIFFFIQPEELKIKQIVNSKRQLLFPLRILCYHVNSTRSCTFIECSQPIRFFVISLMYKNSGFPAPLVVLNSMIKVVRFLKLPSSLCFVIPVNSQLVYRGSSIFRPQRLPLHSRPFPASPCLHVQQYDPFVLLQNA